MKTIITILGARPQFIKASAVSRLFKNDNRVREILVHTGQHYDTNMSQIFFDDLEIPEPQYHLGIGSGGHGKQTGEMLAAIEEVLEHEKPDWVLVYGDTNSTLAGALAAAKLHIPVAHVEAGLRSFNKKMPEEINRIVADQLSTILFVPTKQAELNLKQEGIGSNSICYSGDVMFDAAVYFASKAEKSSHILDSLKLTPKSYVLATIHRAENTNDKIKLSAIFKALATVAEKIPVVLPLHPRTLKLLNEFGLYETVTKTIKIIDPVGFMDMVMLEKNAQVIATDSGGVQKEAFFYQVPCVTLRDETEWVELVNLGWNLLVSPNNAEKIAQTIHLAMNLQGELHVKPYGNGDAAKIILENLI